MAIWDRFARTKQKQTKLTPGRMSEPVNMRWGTLSPYRTRTTDMLTTLRSFTDEVEALDWLVKHDADASMAVNNFTRLSNQGHEMRFYGIGRRKGKRLTDVEDQWRDEFASRVNAISNSGMDGLIDILHRMAFTRGAQSLEAEVAPTRDDIVDVHPITPQTVEWDWEERNGRKVQVPYQRQSNGKRVDLSKANFFWVPTDPDPDDPRGNLLMNSALQAADFQMQVRADLQAILHNQGWPRYDISILLERVMAAMPASVKADPKKQKEWLEARRTEIANALHDLEPDDSFVHFDDAQFNKMQGGEATRSVDIRAIGDMLDVQTMSGFKQMAVLMNRVGKGDSETWSTVQFRIFVSMIQSIQRGSKRLMESVARLWLQVHGIQAVPEFVHKTIDWQAEMEKASVKLAWQKYWAVAQLMKWVDADTAAQEAMGVKNAVGEPAPDATSVSIALGLGGDDVGIHGHGQRMGSLSPDAAPDGAEEGQARRGLFSLFGGRGKGPRGG